MSEQQSVLRAFHGDSALKGECLRRIRSHRTAGTLVRGRVWEEGRGTAVGCTLENPDYRNYEPQLGIPNILAAAEDDLFLGLPLNNYLAWPERFLTAIAPGADLSRVWGQWTLWILGDPAFGTLRLCDEAGARATQTVIHLYQQELTGPAVEMGQWKEAITASLKAGLGSSNQSAESAANAAGWAAATGGDDPMASAIAMIGQAVLAPAYGAPPEHQRKIADQTIGRMADQLIQLLEGCLPTTP